MPQLDTYTAPSLYATPVGKCSEPVPIVHAAVGATAPRDLHDVAVGQRALVAESGRELAHVQVTVATEVEPGDEGEPDAYTDRSPVYGSYR